jgi:D-3-phosphoglycerate dehydrogenase / 2-oxoglutarate reductase
LNGASPRVVITDCDHDNIEPEQRVLAEAGFDVRQAECKTASDVIEQARDADALINQYAPIDESVLGDLLRCRVVVRYGVGVDTIDVEAATRHGVWVVNVPDYGTEEVSDHAFALLLNLLRGVGRYDRAVRSGEWEYSAVRPLRRLRSLTVGVIGCGHIGAEFARKVGCLGARVLGYDTAPIPKELVRDGVLEPTNLDELLARADAVSLHAPLTEQTQHLIGPEQLRRMKPGAYLVNTSRGGLLDQAALLRALDAGKILGAALDVLESEPPEAGDPLVTHERVLVTPHASWYSEESMEVLKSEVAREVVRVLSGERPRSPINEPIRREPDG